MIEENQKTVGFIDLSEAGSGIFAVAYGDRYTVQGEESEFLFYAPMMSEEQLKELVCSVMEFGSRKFNFGMACGEKQERARFLYPVRQIVRLVRAVND